ncbi:unnamed protein product [Adineta steineri]|uniref:Uncharacterized protein n=1 Tax=Adineta steineri TaxID=433720 RepID=A0A819BDM0_9BILA|nr:unnamed protein product [Adineta steineri]CAF3800368.1 unnamed protein product [Adineta steineri]
MVCVFRMSDTGMHLQTYKHFQRVAKAMNNYVAQSAYNFQRGQQHAFTRRAHPVFPRNINFPRFPGRLF